MARVKPLMEVLRGVTRFGRLTVLGEATRIVSPSGFAALAAHVRCDCGVEKVVRASDLNAGYTRSCGCLQRELTAVKIADRNRTHGQSGKVRRTPEYYTWHTMKDRCHNAKSKNFPGYGGRGIMVCERWRNSFEAFFSDMGHRPSSAHSIERINNDGNYEPENCRWATRNEQARNRRSSTAVTVGDRTLTVVEWSEETGVDAVIIYQRLKRGWGPEAAVRTAPMRKGVKRGTEHSKWRKAG